MCTIHWMHLRQSWRDSAHAISRSFLQPGQKEVKKTSILYQDLLFTRWFLDTLKFIDTSCWRLLVEVALLLCSKDGLPITKHQQSRTIHGGSGCPEHPLT